MIPRNQNLKKLSNKKTWISAHSNKRFKRKIETSFLSSKNSNQNVKKILNLNSNMNFDNSRISCKSPLMKSWKLVKLLIKFSWIKSKLKNKRRKNSFKQSERKLLHWKLIRSYSSNKLIWSKIISFQFCHSNLRIQRFLNLQTQMNLWNHSEFYHFTLLILHLHH